MRRDICYFYPVSVDALFDGYYTAATNDKFRREPEIEPYFKMSFGLNFSMKYNFNGGACTLRFMPYQNGSAVNLRFSIAQLAGARYENYAKDLAYDVAQVLGVLPQLIEIDVEYFLMPQNQITADQIVDTEPVLEPTPVCEPVEVPATEPAPTPVNASNITCKNCGATLDDNSKFCHLCGTAVAPKEPEPKFCSQCGTKTKDGALFCTNCGTKI